MPDPLPNADPTGPACPKCGHRPVGDECPACGIVVARYLARNAAAQGAVASPAAPQSPLPPENLQSMLSELKVAAATKAEADAAADEAMPGDFTLWCRGTAVVIGTLFVGAAAGMFLVALSPGHTLAQTSATAAMVVGAAAFPGALFSLATYYAWSVRFSVAWWIVSVTSGGGIALVTLFGSIFLALLKALRPVVRALRWHQHWRALLKVAAVSGALPLVVAGATALRGASSDDVVDRYLATPSATPAQQKSQEDASILNGIEKLQTISAMQSGGASDDLRALLDSFGPTLQRGTLGAVRRALDAGRLFVRLDGAFYEVALRDAPEPGRWTIARFHQQDGTSETRVVEDAGAEPPW